MTTQAPAVSNRKPDTRTAMRQLIAEVRDALPFAAPASQVCSGDCDGCSVKLLEYLDGELCGWQQRLDVGETPSLGDLARLAKTSRKVHAVLARNGLVAGPQSGTH
jgi:hypothetical protein